MCQLKIWPMIRCNFLSKLELLNNIKDKKFVPLVERTKQDFEPNPLSSFSELELASMEKSLKLNNNHCHCLLNCVNQLLKDLKDVNWALNISSNVGIELFDLEPRCLIKLKVKDNQYN
ncbi:hypothetical protein QTP88_012391 [Uroleucon formosanum]